MKIGSQLFRFTGESLYCVGLMERHKAFGDSMRVVPKLLFDYILLCHSYTATTTPLVCNPSSYSTQIPVAIRILKSDPSQLWGRGRGRGNCGVLFRQFASACNNWNPRRRRRSTRRNWQLLLQGSGFAHFTNE